MKPNLALCRKPTPTTMIRNKGLHKCDSAVNRSVSVVGDEFFFPQGML